MDANRKNQFKKTINGLNIIADYLLNGQEMLTETYNTETLDQTFKTVGLDMLINDPSQTDFQYKPSDNPQYKNILYVRNVMEAHTNGIRITHATSDDLASPMALTRFIYAQAPVLQKTDEKYHIVDIVRKMEMADVVRTVVTAPVTPKPVHALQMA